MIFYDNKITLLLKELVGEDIKFVVGQKETHYERGYNKKYQELTSIINSMGY